MTIVLMAWRHLGNNIDDDTKTRLIREAAARQRNGPARRTWRDCGKSEGGVGRRCLQPRNADSRDSGRGPRRQIRKSCHVGHMYEMCLRDAADVSASVRHIVLRRMDLMTG